MRTKKKYWFLNILIVATIAICLLAFAAHYKNWTKIEDDGIKILSGVYFKEIPYTTMNTVMMVPKLPSMERISGFSAMTMEKGVFKDSITQAKTYVFVDDLNDQKIKLVYQDSMNIFINLRNSTQTMKMYQMLLTKIKSKASAE